MIFSDLTELGHDHRGRAAESAGPAGAWLVTGIAAVAAESAGPAGAWLVTGIGLCAVAWAW